MAAAEKEGSTALIYAAREGHVECVRLLLQHSRDAQLAVVDSHHSVWGSGFGSMGWTN